MPRRSVELLECDRPAPHSGEAEVYEVHFPDGIKEFILCDKHNGPLLKLKDVAYGTFKKKQPRRRFKKVEL